jgi:hypothetical protein
MGTVKQEEDSHTQLRLPVFQRILLRTHVKMLQSGGQNWKLNHANPTFTITCLASFVIGNCDIRSGVYVVGDGCGHYA